MAGPIRTTVPNLVLPSQQDRDRAAQMWGSRQAHDQLVQEWPCLKTIELAMPAAPSPNQSTSLTVAAWNIERCKEVEASAQRLEHVGADIVLATEMDLGMARSGQRHTTRDLAHQLGFGYAFGVEFVELGLGDDFETAACAGMSNRHGLHGNAILSRWPLLDVTLIPLDEGGGWFVRAPKNDGQYRVGGRMAMAARIETASGEIAVVSVHYESESDAAGRAAQTQIMLTQLDELFGPMPAIIGGDLNTKAFLDAGMSPQQILAEPEKAEPSFEHFAKHGFDWRASNLGEVTTRLPPHGPQDRPLKTLDWLFTRGVQASSPFILPALSATGEYLSDHEMIGATITP